MQEELVKEGIRLAAIVVFKAVVGTVAAHYTKRFLVTLDNSKAKKKAATAA